MVKHNMYSWTAGLIRRMSNSELLESLSIPLPHSPVHQLPLDLHNMRALQRLTLQDIEPAAGFRLPPTCLLFLSKPYGGREQLLQHASLAQATELEVDGHRRSGSNIPLPLGKLLPQLRTLILTVWPDVDTPFDRMKHDVGGYQGIPNVILKFRTQVELSIPPHPLQSLVIEGKSALDIRMSNPESFVQRVGCFRFQSAHSKHSSAMHFAAGTKKACKVLELPGRALRRCSMPQQVPHKALAGASTHCCCQQLQGGCMCRLKPSEQPGLMTGTPSCNHARQV